MLAPAIPDNELARLNALYELALLDTPNDERFDRITRLTQQFFEFPIVSITLIDKNRQWFKSIIGLDICETSRDTSFCGHTILSDHLLSIEDTHLDPRFSDNSFVINAPFIRSYFGVPLSDPAGYHVGTLCLLDTQPRKLSESQKLALSDFAKLTEQELVRFKLTQQASTIELTRAINQQVLQNTNDAIVLIDESGLIVEANQIFQQCFATQAEGLIHQPIDTFLSHDLLEKIDLIPTSLNTPLLNPIELTATLLNHQKQVFPAYVRHSQLKLDKQQFSLIVIRDLSQMKQQQRELEQFKQIIDSSRDMVFILDPSKLQFIYVNKGAQKRLGYSQEEFLHLSPQAIHIGKQENELKELIKPLLMNMVESVQFESRHKTREGGSYPVEVYVQKLRDAEGHEFLLGLARDITNRKLQAIEKELFYRLFEQTHQGIGIANPKGEMVYSNTAHDQILGRDKAQVIGHSVTEFHTKEQNERLFATINQHLPFNKTWSGIVEVTRPNGDKVLTMARIGGILDDNGDIQFMYNMLDDYSAVIARENELQAALKQAEEANIAKNCFLSSMSHELRTPLNSIIGFAQLLKISPLSDKQQDQLDYIYSSGQHLLTLINQVLDYAKIEAGGHKIDIKQIDLSNLLNDCAHLVEPILHKHQVTLKPIDIDPLMPFAKADLTGLKQALLNLLTNAAKYNHLGGYIELKTHYDARTERVQIFVIDNGKGIPLPHQTKVFEAFNRLGHEGHEVEGTGIGLTITKTLVNQMNGEIGFESTEGKGTTFWIALPAN